MTTTRSKEEQGELRVKQQEEAVEITDPIFATFDIHNHCLPKQNIYHYLHFKQKCNNDSNAALPLSC